MEPHDPLKRAGQDSNVSKEKECALRKEKRYNLSREIQIRDNMTNLKLARLNRSPYL